MKIVYIAEDGKEFKTAAECKDYEDETRHKKRKLILTEIWRLDQEIYFHYYPHKDTWAMPAVELAPSWLEETITTVLSEDPDSEDMIIKMIRNSKYGETILSDFVKMKKCRKAAKIRGNFGEALKSVKEGSDLAHDIGYGFSDEDLSELAQLHKAKKYRKKIEDLLTACNFHDACSDFKKKRYMNYIYENYVQEELPFY